MKEGGGWIRDGDFYLLSSTQLYLPPLRSTLSEDAGIEPRTVATLALAVFDAYSARYHIFQKNVLLRYTANLGLVSFKYKNPY
jgi:hypothetical protein